MRNPQIKKTPELGKYKSIDDVLYHVSSKEGVSDLRRTAFTHFMIAIFRYNLDIQHVEFLYYFYKARLSKMYRNQRSLCNAIQHSGYKFKHLSKNSNNILKIISRLTDIFLFKNEFYYFVEPGNCVFYEPIDAFWFHERDVKKYLYWHDKQIEEFFEQILELYEEPKEGKNEYFLFRGDEPLKILAYLDADDVRG